MSKQRGLFITLEGVDGTGKSTQLKQLTAKLRQHKVPLVCTREVGGTTGAEAIRSLWLTDEHEWLLNSELLLIFAARYDHVAKIIRPALAAGKTVICDRFTDSTRVYQGKTVAARQIITRLEHMLLGGLQPDLTLILDAPLAATRWRRRTRTADRFEAAHAAQETMRRKYRQLAKSDPKRYQLIDASQPLSLVSAAVWQTVAKRLKIKE